MSNNYISNTFRTLTVLFAALVLSESSASICHASCGLPPFGLVWSSPADGASDVPLNAVMQLLTSRQRSGTWVATLNDVELTSDNDSRFDLGLLAADTDYVFRIADRQSRTEMPTLEVRFRTGSASAAELPAPVVASTNVEPSIPGLSELCSKALGAQACWDTGPYKIRTFDLADSAAVAYLVAAEGGAEMLFPAGCEPLASEWYSPNPDSQICYVVRALDVSGNTSEPTRHCPAREPEEATSEQAITAAGAPTTPTCSIQHIASAKTPAWLGSLFAVLAFVTVRRSRRWLAKRGPRTAATLSGA